MRTHTRSLALPRPLARSRRPAEMAKGARSNSKRHLHSWRRDNLKAEWQAAAEARKQEALLAGMNSQPLPVEDRGAQEEAERNAEARGRGRGEGGEGGGEDVDMDEGGPPPGASHLKKYSKKAGKGVRVAGAGRCVRVLVDGCGSRRSQVHALSLHAPLTPSPTTHAFTNAQGTTSSCLPACLPAATQPPRAA